MRTNFFFLFFVFVITSLSYAKDVTVLSPNKQIELRVNDKESLSYDVYFQKELVFEKCQLSLNFTESKQRPLVIRKTRRFSLHEKFSKEIPGGNKEILNNCNGIELKLNGGYTVEFRVFDNAYAYRFITKENDSINVYSENCTLNFPIDYKAHLSLSKSFWSSYEEPYTHLKTTQYGAEDNISHLPILLESEKGLNILMSETDLTDYPCMFFKSTGDNGITATFPKVPLTFGKGNDRAVSIKSKADYIARTVGKRNFPWRYVVISNNASDMMEHDMTYILSSPCEIKDISWIKPGQVSWEWWHDARLYGVDFKSGYNTDSYKYYIDFASKYGIPYILMDEGWALDTRDPFVPNKNVDLHYLIDYAKQRNVKIILWLSWLTVENNFNLFKAFSDWGVAGVKIDFMNRSDQWMVNFYERVAKEAAKNHLIVDFHGSFKPAGLERRYPNVLAYEGVLGLEMGARCVPNNSIYYPFIRNAVGPMDFTPGSMISAQPEDNRYTRSNAMGSGTRAYQMALYVVFKSGLQMLADNPVYYKREHECTEFITSVPTTWDETKVLSAKVGEYVVIARRKGSSWFIGAITNDKPREFNLSLDFLNPKATFNMVSFQDGINADKQAMDYKKKELKVDSSSNIKINLVRNGGWAARIEMQ